MLVFNAIAPTATRSELDPVAIGSCISTCGVENLVEVKTSKVCYETISNICNDFPCFCHLLWRK